MLDKPVPVAHVSIERSRRYPEPSIGRDVLDRLGPFVDDARANRAGRPAMGSVEASREQTHLAEIKRSRARIGQLAMDDDVVAQLG